MVGYHEKDKGGEPLEQRVMIFTERDYALIGPGGETANCRAWTRRKFKRWLKGGMFSIMRDEHGDPIFFPEKTEPGAAELGCYWMRVRAVVGSVPLYVLLRWPFAQEIGKMVGVELEDPRG